MTIRVEHGDCLTVLPMLAAEGVMVDSCVTDPPYHLTSIVKRFGKPDSAPCIEGATGAYARASRGFMGKVWDGGDVAFRPETWAAVMAVMKPGAHLIAFSGTRTYHRMACAIEDAGFEIRDQLAWAYGSGFPKSHDIGKGIDRAAGVEREVVGTKRAGIGRVSRDGGEVVGGTSNEAAKLVDITAPTTIEAARWEGWGTALKPAWEPIVLARKPLSEKTIAGNVLAHGTGGLNIGACRIEIEAGNRDVGRQINRGVRAGVHDYGLNKHEAGVVESVVRPEGRWPANLCHDGSEEVLAGFPDTGPGSGAERRNGEFKSVAKGRELPHSTFGHADAGGSAARFFYSSKSDASDRLGSKHPTVKPTDLMAWLCRLVTPPGGTVLDPFAGSGSTGMACLREGFDAILIEREAEYVADIGRRIAHVSGEDSPLFMGAAA